MENIKKVYSFLSIREKRKSLVIFFISLGSAVLETLSILSIIPFLTLIGNPEILFGNSWLSKVYYYFQPFGINTPIEFIMFVGVFSLTSIIFSSVFRSFAAFRMNEFIEMLRHYIGIRLFKIYLSQPYTFFIENHSDDLVKRLLAEVDQVVTYVIRPLIRMISYGIVLFFLVIALLIIDFSMTLLIVGFLLIVYLFFYRILQKRFKFLGENLVESNKSRFIVSGELIGGIKEIKLLGKESTFLEKFSFFSKRYAQTYSTHETMSQIPSFIIESLIFSLVISITIFFASSTGDYALDKSLGLILPKIGFFAFGAYRIKPALHHVYNGVTGLKYGSKAVEILYSDLSNKASTHDSHEMAKLVPKKVISLSDVSFQYPSSGLMSLKNISWEIKIGSSYGIVGSTGAGKTSLVDIFLGLLSPTNGSLYCDSILINSTNVKSWQRNIGYVPQEIFLTDNTIAENIAIGVEKSKIDYDRVYEASKIAQLYDFVMSDLPDSFNTIIGERGIRLSGGQRQRIGIARAIYNDPSVLVFDEATSALDNHTENLVMKAISTLTKEKTIIIIAHRISTVQNCDEIIVLDNGSIVGKGSYKDLIENDQNFKKFIQ